MSSLTNEREFQNLIMKHLKEVNNYQVRKNENYSKLDALDIDLLEKFLIDTQLENYEKLRPSNGLSRIMFFIQELNKEIDNFGLLHVIQNGLMVSNLRFNLLYLQEKSNKGNVGFQYSKNIVSVIEELVFSEEGRSDIVIFLNGIPIITFELKCEDSNQSYLDAIIQYKTSRKNYNLLFEFNKRSLVHFAMDTSEIWMTTKLRGDKTKFLPFNKGVDGHGGNLIIEGKKATCYMWEDILQKDTLIYLIGKLMVVERSSQKTTKYSVRDTLIFPRYHQLDCIRKTVKDIENNCTCLNYLVQHSTGSGKTNTISWLAYALTNIYKDGKLFYDKILIITDRVVVDKQLKVAVQSMNRTNGVSTVTKSKDLPKLLQDKTTNIIICTIQLMSYVSKLLDGKIKDYSVNSNYAIIIDEAHQSTNGDYMSSIIDGINTLTGENETITDYITRKMKATGKKDNISVFAFTATPKKVTLDTFGRRGKNGLEPFHTYPMQQAIEEGYILDVLHNYKRYKGWYTTKTDEIAKDIKMTHSEAKRKIGKHFGEDDKTILEKAKIILNEFMACTYTSINGNAKAMVITDSRLCAVKYKIVLDKLFSEREIKDVKTLVAFTGDLEKPSNHTSIYLEDDVKYNEGNMNKISGISIENKFKEKDYRILIVANKFQTGFNAPLLHTMFVDKKLEGVNAVQTLSRLNRVAKYKTDTYVVDFRNTFDDLKDAFKQYAGITCLENGLSIDALEKCYNKTIKCGVTDREEVSNYTEVADKASKSYNKDMAIFILDCCKERLKQLDTAKLDLVSRQFKIYLSTYKYVSASNVIEDRNLVELNIFAKDMVDRMSLILRDRNYKTSVDIDNLVRHEGIRIEESERVLKEESIRISSKEEREKKENIVLSKFNISVEARDLPQEQKVDLLELITELNYLTAKTDENGVTTSTIDEESMLDTLAEVSKSTIYNEDFVNKTKDIYANNPKDRADEICEKMVKKSIVDLSLKKRKQHFKNVKMFIDDKIFKPFSSIIINKTRSKMK